MFGYLDEAEIWRRLKSQRIEAYRRRHITEPAGAVRSNPRRCAQRFSIVDEELERGLRAIAVPVLDRSRQAGRRDQPHPPTRRARPATRCANISFPSSTRIAEPDLVDDRLIRALLLPSARVRAVSLRISSDPRTLVR